MVSLAIYIKNYQKYNLSRNFIMFRETADCLVLAKPDNEGSFVLAGLQVDFPCLLRNRGQEGGGDWGSRVLFLVGIWSKIYTIFSIHFASHQMSSILQFGKQIFFSSFSSHGETAYRKRILIFANLYRVYLWDPHVISRLQILLQNLSVFSPQFLKNPDSNLFQHQLRPSVLTLLFTICSYNNSHYMFLQ